MRSLHIGAGTTNDDGIDPESCKNVLIENCVIHTHDDCVAVKSRSGPGWMALSCLLRILLFDNNSFTTEVGSGFCIGSEMSAGVRNVFVEHCELVAKWKTCFSI